MKCDKVLQERGDKNNIYISDRENRIAYIVYICKVAVRL